MRLARLILEDLSFGSTVYISFYDEDGNETSRHVITNILMRDGYLYVNCYGEAYAKEVYLSSEIRVDRFRSTGFRSRRSTAVLKKAGEF